MASALRKFGTVAFAAAIGSAVLLPVQAFAAPATASAVAQPAAPTLVSPADDPAAANPLKDIALHWNAVSGATGYQVQVSPNAQWTNNTVDLPDSGDTVATTYEVPVSLPHASYFWRVRALDGSVKGAWSSTRQFLHDWDGSSNVDGAFTMLTAPGPDALFSWTPVKDASLYEVRVSNDRGFSPDADTRNCFTAATSLEPYVLDSGNPEAITGDCFSEADLTNGTAYYWEVRPLDDSSAAAITADTTNDPAWECAQSLPECDGFTQSGQFTFTAPAAGSPTTVVTGLKATWNNGSATTDCTNGLCPTTPTLSWNAVPGANFYDVHVYLDPDGTNTFRDYHTPYTSLTPRDLYMGNQAGRSYYWTVSPGTCQNSSSDPTCAAPSADTSGITCPSGSGTSAPTITGVSAAPVSGDGNIPGGHSETVTVTGTNFDSGACVTASAGTVDKTTYDSPTQLTVSYSSPISSSKTQVTFTVTNSDGSVSGASNSLTVDPAQQATFYPTLGAVSAFKVQTGTVAPTAPADGATVNPTDLTFAWGDFQAGGGQGALEARNYDLQIATDAEFNNVVDDVSTIDMTQYTPTTALGSGTYYWRIAAVDESGHLLAWSDSRKLAVDASNPKVSLATKSGVSVNGTLTVASNQPLQGVVTGANSPSFELQPATGGQAVLGRVTKVSGQRWRLRPNAPLVTGQSYTLVLGSGLTDAVGNPAVVSGSAIRTTTKADDTSAAWTSAGHWAQQRSSNAKGGSYVVAGKGATATLHIAGSKATLYGCKAPRYGTETVSVDGHRVATVSLSHRYTECGMKLWRGSLKSGQHTVRIRVTKGTGDIDAVDVS